MDAVLSRVAVVQAAHVACEPGWAWESRPETFAHHNLWCVHRGRGSMRLGGREIELSRGRVMVLRPGSHVVARHDPADPLRVTYVHFHPLDAAGDRRRPPVAGLPPVTKRVAAAELFELCCRRIARLDDLPGGRAEAEAFLTALLIGLRAEHDNAADETGPREALLDLAAWVREHPAEATAGGVAGLAAMAGYSPDHFTELFAAATGRTPGAYLIAARTDRAGHLLRHGRLPVARIAAALGYSSPAYFARQFKQQTGRTPAAYRALTD